MFDTAVPQFPHLQGKISTQQTGADETRREQEQHDEYSAWGGCEEEPHAGRALAQILLLSLLSVLLGMLFLKQIMTILLLYYVLFVLFFFPFLLIVLITKFNIHFENGMKSRIIDSPACLFAY